MAPVDQLFRRINSAGVALCTDADTEEASATMSAIGSDYVLRSADTSSRSNLTILRIGNIAACTSLYTGDTEFFQPKPSADHATYNLIFAALGRQQIHCTDDELIATPASPVLLGPHRESRGFFAAGTYAGGAQIPRAPVEAMAESMAGKSGPVHFEGRMSQSASGVMTLLEGAAAIANTSAAELRPSLVPQLERLIVETLLLCQPSNLTERLHADAGRLPSKRVRQAMAYMSDHLDQPLGVAAVAAECATSVRSLQTAFRRELDTTPGQWLKQRRLEHAYSLLSAGDAGSVTDAAYSSGFLHLGDFGVAFKKRYGRTPSSVLATSPANPQRRS